MPIFYSNSLEKCIEALSRSLFGANTTPFEKRIVIVPDEEIKDLLLQKMAQDPNLGVAAGVGVLSLSRALVALKPTAKYLPSYMELSLQIEDVLSTLYGEEGMEPVFTYIGKETSSKRLGALSDQLSHLFIRYGLYGEGFLDKWLMQIGWQQRVWKSVFSRWTFPIEALKGNHSCGSQVHLFGFNYLPPVYVRFFHQLKSHFYQFSPCCLFWEDLSSDKERVYQRRKKDAYDVESNPLLANWGKLGREALKQFDAGEMITEEEYVEPLSSLLGSVQMAILESSSDCLSIEVDHSIALHSAPSKLREVEIVYDELCRIFDRHSKDPNPIYPQDVLILTPNIQEYAPFIQMVFGAQENPIPYRIQDVPDSSQGDALLGFLHLLKLPKERFSAESVLKLLKFSSFSQKWNLSAEDIHKIERWVKRAHIRWGLSQESRKEILNAEFSGVGTWEHGIDRLLWGLVMTAQEEGSIIPCSGLEWSGVDLFGQFIDILKALEESLRVLGSKKSIPSWLKYLEKLAEQFFSIEKENGFLRELKNLKSSLAHLVSEQIPFASMERVVAHCINRGFKMSHSSQLNAVTFCSLNNQRLQPARVVWMLGMDEGVFPRLDQKLSLCEMTEAPYIMKLVDQDRYRFLQLFMTASDYFLMSYQRVSPQDHKEQSPSLLVQELLNYLPNLVTCHHPVLPFDKTYFSERQSYSKSLFASAEAYYGKKKRVSPSFFGKPLKASQDSLIIDIAKLSSFARHPIRFYLTEALGIYMKMEEEGESEEFLLSAKTLAALRKKAVKESLASCLKVFEAQGKLPLGALQQVAFSEVAQAMKDFKESLDTFSVKEEEIFTIEFSSSCQEKLQRSANHWIFPALSVPLQDGREAKIIGKMGDVTPQGLLFHGEDELPDLVKSWPLFLVYLNSGAFPKQLLLTKCGKIRPGHFENPLSLLAEYIAYYEQSLIAPSFCMPQWAPAILQKQEMDLEKAIESSVTPSMGGFEDECLLWLKNRDSIPDASLIFKRDAIALQSLFAPLLGGNCATV